MKLVSFIIFCSASILGIQAAFSQATITETQQKFKTYAFSDPDPVAKITKYYPYFRFDGFTNTPVEKEWKIVILENKYIKVFVAPELGGKVLGAIEKSTGEEFIYLNKVVKFRDISMRGAWTSGGIEFNFGSIGHAPTTASPVNYLLRNNDDGSVSCFVGAPEITSRTEWRVEIRLPANTSYFETKALWYNPSDEKTSLYNWMTASVDASYDLEYFFPGHTEIGHEGEFDSWPLNKDGIKISMYKNNTFGGPKSYHVLGEYAEDFLCYFHDKEFGLGHWSAYDEKPGQKIWLWALSREGEIWADLLTDPGNIQYTEIQTGLLFNQAGTNSTFSPFKHLFFDEGAEYKFTELWFPVKGIGGMVKANETGSLNVVRNGTQATIGFCANQQIADDLIILADGKELARKNIKLNPTEFFNETFEIGFTETFEVKIGDSFSYKTNEAGERKLSKPIKINEGYDWNSIDGILTEGTELEKQRLYDNAREKYELVLERDAFNTDALTRMAALSYRSMEYEKANDYAFKALANNTYHPEANYIFGLVSKKYNKKYDALDAFSMAARSVGYKSVANAQIAAIWFTEGEMQKSLKYADQALDYDCYNMNALKLKALIYGKIRQLHNQETVLDEILNIDPLNAFALFEKKVDFEKVLNYEMPDQICLELAIWYYNLGLNDKAAEVLKKTSATPIINYWLAFILQDQQLLNQAIAGSPDLIFPFRPETAEVLDWALAQNDNWKTKYYLGLIYWSKGRIKEANKYFENCSMQPEFFAFYLTRFELLNGETGYSGEFDLNKAMELAPGEWRCYKALSDYYGSEQNFTIANEWAAKGFAKFPENYILAYQLSKNLLIAGKYEESLNILTKTTILPNEGASAGRVTYRQDCIMDAVSKLQSNKKKSALVRIDQARKWPENLGVGKPYDTDERIEDYLESLYWNKAGKSAKAKELEDKIVDFTMNSSRLSSGLYLGAILLRKSGNQEEAKKLLENWSEKQPNNAVVNWCLAKFNGENEKAENILNEIKKVNGGTLFNARTVDSEFPLIQAISEIN